MTLDKFLDDINEADLRQLIETKVPAGKTVEYRERLPDDTYESQKEFLADVSSFANTADGHLLYGIQSENGIPVALRGIASKDLEHEILRLEALIENHLQPKCQGIRIGVVDTACTSPLLVIRIPESWAKPHVVSFQGHWRFYARNAAGKYSLGVTELKSACLATTGLGERIRSFHSDRLSKISSEELPVSLMGSVRTVFHLIPYSAFEAGSPLSLAAIEDIWSIPLMYASASNYRYNLDGLMVYHEEEAGGCSEGYTQVFRNGIIESVNANLFGSSIEGPHVPRVTFERDVTDFLDACLACYRNLSVGLPAVFFVTLVGTQHYKLGMNRHQGARHSRARRIPANALLLPEVILESPSAYSAAILKPIFRTVWNSIGWEMFQGYAGLEKKDLVFNNQKRSGEKAEVSHGHEAKKHESTSR